MNVEKAKIPPKNEKSKTPRTIKDIEDTLKEMDKIHNTSFYNWIKDENNVSVIAFKTKELFQEHYEKQPELVYNALRFLCKDWKLSKIAELILKLFYKCNVASKKLAIIVYEVSLLLENPEKVDLISLLLIGEEPKNVAFFLYYFFQYTEKKYREHTKIINEEEFLDEMSAFCSGIIECLFTSLKWNNEYFRELIIEYITLSTLEIDARREFLIRMVNVKYSRFQQEIQNRKDNNNTTLNQIKDDKEENNNTNIDDNLSNTKINEKIEENGELFKRSLNFGILVFNMYQVVMRTEVDDLLIISPPTKETSNMEVTNNSKLSRDKTLNMNENDDENDDDILLSDTSISICSNKRTSLKREEGDISILSNDDEDIFLTSRNNEEECMKKEESSATLWMDDDENDNGITTTTTTISNNMNESFEYSDINVSKDSIHMSSIYNFGCDSSFCKNNDEPATTIGGESSSDSVTDTFSSSYHFEELYCEEEDNEEDDDDDDNENINNNNNNHINEIDLLDDLINKSFNSAVSSSRRNSMLSFCSLMNDLSNNNNNNNIDNSMEEGGNSNKNNSGNSKINGFEGSSSNRRNSRYSLSLSVQSMPCFENNNMYSRGPDSDVSTPPLRYNNYSDNLLYIFPSPPISPTLNSAPPSPTFRLNDHDYNPLTTGKSTTTTTTTNFNNEMEEDLLENSFCNSSFISLNESNSQPSPMTSTTPSSNLYRPFSPEMNTPSPIVQSLSMDNIFVGNGCNAYSCTFNHIHSTSSTTTSTNNCRQPCDN